MVVACEADRADENEKRKKSESVKSRLPGARSTFARVCYLPPSLNSVDVQVVDTFLNTYNN